jgi:hypothetical protein
MTQQDPKRRTDSHVGERVENLRVLITLGPWLFLVLTIAEVVMVLRGMISVDLCVVLVAFANPLIILGTAKFLRRALGDIAERAMGTLLSTRGTPHTREFSEMESLVIRGQCREAAERYDEFLVAFPRDTDAWMRLAALQAGELQQPERAVVTYLRARETGPTPPQERIIGNALIDLHRAAGDRHALRAELARFARLNRGTAVGRKAQEALQQLPS